MTVPPPIAVIVLTRSRGASGCLGTRARRDVTFASDFRKVAFE